MARAATRKDPMLAGFQFLYAQDKNPYDFITDPETGQRPGESRPPNSFVKIPLDHGTRNITLPPLEIWKQGQWLADMDHAEITGHGTLPDTEDHYDTWVTPGEGTPGNYVWRMFFLPATMSRDFLDAQLKPKHPMLWPKKFKDPPTPKKVSSSSSSSSGGGWSYKKQDAGLPYGVRIRCTQCGHWFKTDDLPSHLKCCPQANGFSDWAIACECCASLDDTANVKDGYPRDFITGKGAENGAGEDATERASGDPSDAEGIGDANGSNLGAG